MNLSENLIKEFAKLTNDTGSKAADNKLMYGTVVEYDNSKWVRIDGSDLLTPISLLTNVSNGDRVVVGIENHAATVHGNLTSPSANNRDVENLETIMADKISTEELEAEFAKVGLLLADYAKISYLEANYARIDTLEANYARIDTLQSEYVKTSTLEAEKAEITSLFANYATISVLQSNYATIENLQATNARIDSITSNSIDTEYLNANYANINFSNITKVAMETFYAQSGLIDNVTINNGTITGNLVGVTISGDLIEGNTIVADKLVVKGDDGLYYKLNTDGIKVEAEQTDYNSINGSVIKAKSIAATKISVQDLTAFGATIGGFKITENSIYSGVKESVDNATRGIYMDNLGQMVLGDGSNYVKYYKDTDNNYKLKISATDITFSATGKTVQDMINDISVGGRNLVRGTGDASGWTTYTSFNKTDREFVKSLTTTSEGIMSSSNCFDLKAGETYTLSFKAKQNGYVKHGEVYILPATYMSTGIAYNNIFNVGTEYREYEFVFVPNANATSLKNCVLRFDNNGSTVNGTEAIFYVKDIKLEKGNKATDWTPAPEDINYDISAAAKTATNFMSYDSTNGLLIGNKTSGSWSGNRAQILPSAFNVLDSSGTQLASFGTTATIGKSSSHNVYIDSDSVDIRNGSTILASFNAKTIELGLASKDAMIELCGGVGQISANSINDNSVFDKLQISSANISIISDTQVYLESLGPNTSVNSYFQADQHNNVSGDYVGNYTISKMCSSAGTKGNSSHSLVQTTAYEGYTDANVTIRATDSTNNVSSAIEVYPEYVKTESKTLNLLVDDVAISGKLNVSGMTTFSQTATMNGSLVANGTSTFNNGIEISHATPYIDFHFGKSTVDYTSRIIENEKGVLTVTGGLKVAGITTLNALNVNSNTHLSGHAYLEQSGTGENTFGIYGELSTGVYREMMRMGGSSTAPILIIGDGLYTNKLGTTHISSGTGVTLLTSNNRITFYDVTGYDYTGIFRPNAKAKCVLGASAYTWHTIYAANATIQTSDRREKENILPLGESPIATFSIGGRSNTIDIHSELFDRLQPVQYNFIDGNGRTCYGLVAQDVIDAMDELGIGENELDLIHHDYYIDEETGEEKETYGLAYANLIALLIHEVQKLKVKVNELSI